MQPNRKAIATTARWTRWGVTVLMVVTLAFQIMALIPGMPHVQLHRLGRGPLSDIVALSHALFMLIALVQLILLLRHIERGELFSAGVTRRLRGFALFTLLAVAVGGLLAPIAAFLFPDCAAGAHCVRRIPFDMRSLWNLVISVVFFLVARILDEARRIDEDNSQII